MCGIAGNVAGIVQDKAGTLASISHRGPDAQGELQDDNVWLAHTRLSILDLSEAGAQPMTSACGRWIVVFNGELYNHLELREEILSHNSHLDFRGHSDTETLIEYVAAFGVAQTLNKLNGMFGLALWDKEAKCLWLARDPYGIKPVYYASRAESLYFASELKAIKAMGIDLVPRKSGLSSFLTVGYLPSPYTLFEGINRLPAGHFLRWSEGKTTVTPYIRPSNYRLHHSNEEATRLYQVRLQEAVERQLLSDVPVGVLLSGGIDSALVASMAREAGRKLTGFTVGFKRGVDDCEIDDAAETAAILGLEHRMVRVDPEGLWSNMKAIVSSLEEPISSPSALPLWDLVKLARSEVTVVLTGQGSDELWGGYRRYQMDLLRAHIPDFVLSKMSFLNKGAHFKRTPLWVTRALSSFGLTDQNERFLSAYSLFSKRWRTDLLGEDNPFEAREQVEYWLDWLEGEHLHSSEQMMRIDTKMQLADDFLIYGDKISMAVALEMRVPMLDIELSSWVDSLPLQQKVQLRKTKILHKKMAEQYLPSRIVHRKKKGFQVPIQAWCRSIWKERCEQLLFRKGAPLLQFLNPSSLKRFWEEIQVTRADRSRQLFSVLMLALWLEWLDELQ
ncbi:MAG: asparagine synthase (glutamine-hydrolyzing) [Proteobacteria bacterium]|nr:asparagine synthase (glutamine-hydrolyzing) [Pseudomonadota bacterium]